jgi:hypothetical protein
MQTAPLESILNEEFMEDDDDLLQTINDKLPENTCDAHPFMIMFMQKVNKNMNKKFKNLDSKIDPIVEFVSDKQKSEKRWQGWKDKLVGFGLGIGLILVSYGVTQLHH